MNIRKYDKGEKQIADHGFMCQRNGKKVFYIKELLALCTFQ